MFKKIILKKGANALMKSKKVNELRKKAAAVLGLGTMGAAGAGATGAYMAAQRKIKGKN